MTDPLCEDVARKPDDSRWEMAQSDYLYWAVALGVQALFWWFSMPGPQLRGEVSFTAAMLACAWSVVTLFLIPAGFLWLRQVSLWQLGLGSGDWRFGIKAFAICAPAMLVGTWVGSYDVAIQDYYPIPGDQNLASVSSKLMWWLAYGTFYFSFEFFYRGYLLRGSGSPNWVLCCGIQAVCCFLIHIGKPPAELFASLPASILFGWIAYRSRSIWYVFALHFAIGVTNDLGALWQANGSL